MSPRREAATRDSGKAAAMGATLPCMNKLGLFVLLLLPVPPLAFSQIDGSSSRATVVRVAFAAA